MVAFFSILLAVVLLGVTVYGLHRYQTMEVEYTVDRSMPLPPLEAEPEVESDIAGHAPNPPAGKADAGDGRAGQARADSRKEAGSSHKGKARPRNTQAWLAEVNALKSDGDMAAALSRCRREFPLWGAYNQACIILRAQLKETPASDPREDALLRELHTLAATAELLHDKSGDTPTLSLGQIRQLDLSQLDELDFPYAAIGYAHLRLIRKSDIRLMQARWGRPEQHQLPRQYHQGWWQAFTATQS